MLRLIVLKRFYGTIIFGFSSSKIDATANKWSSYGRGRHAIPGLYYVVVAFIGLFSTIMVVPLPSNGKKLTVLIDYDY